MNRTIKFRGKVLHRKSHQKNEWVYGMPTIFRDGRTAIRWQCSEKAKDPESWKTQSVEPETLGQFTGLHDKNGKEIYEGDIILCKGKHQYKVEWIADGFCMRGDRYGGVTSIKSFLPIQREIIGNIHSNPELLNEK